MSDEAVNSKSTARKKPETEHSTRAGIVISPLEALLDFVGETVILASRAFGALIRGGLALSDLTRQMSAIGVDSIWIVLVVTTATGAVFAYYTASLSVSIGFSGFVGGSLGYAFLNELGPVLGGVAFAARSGAAIAAEIGTMVVTEQVDALRAMAVQPVRYLVLPRLLAAVIMLPLLIVFADIAGLIGGYVFAGASGVPHASFINSVYTYVKTTDLINGLIKAVWFGFSSALSHVSKGFAPVGAQREWGDPRRALWCCAYYSSSFLMYFSHRSWQVGQVCIDLDWLDLAMSSITLRNVIYDVPQKRVLNGVNLHVETGKIVSIMGQSGSGKTTLLKLMTGLIKPTSGEILIDDVEISRLNETELDKVRLKMGLVFQYAALFDSLTVYDNIIFGVVRHRKGIKREELDKIVHDLLAEVNLEGTEKQFPSELSGGMQKRVGLARALAMNPSVIFYDEPTSGLDPITGHTIDQLILDTRKRTSVTSVVVSHHLPSIFAISDQVAMLYHGEVVIYDTPDNVKNTDNPVVQAFLAPERDSLFNR